MADKLFCKTHDHAQQGPKSSNRSELWCSQTGLSAASRFRKSCISTLDSATLLTESGTRPSSVPAPDRSASSGQSRIPGFWDAYGCGLRCGWYVCIVKHVESALGTPLAGLCADKAWSAVAAAAHTVELEVKVEGMKCGGCSSRVEAALKVLLMDGVTCACCCCKPYASHTRICHDVHAGSCKHAPACSWGSLLLGIGGCRRPCSS